MTMLVPTLIAVAMAAVAAAAGLRRLGLRSDGIVAGVLVGMLAGPAVLGRIAPETWSHAMLGADADRAALEQAISERQAFRVAAGAASAAGVLPDSTAAALAGRDAEIERLRTVAADGMMRHARPWTIATVSLAVLAFWLGWAAFRPVGRDASDVGVSAVVALSGWVALLPAFATIVVFRLLGREPTDPEVLTAASCLAIAGWPPGGGEARLLDRLGVRGLAASTAAFATIIAAMIALGARLAGGSGWALVALPLLVFRLGPSPRTIRARMRCRRLLTGVVLPSLAALAVVRSEFLIETPWIATIAMLLIAGDGRGFGWLFGLRFSGVASSPPMPERHDACEPDVRHPTVTWTTALTASGAGGAQLCFAAIALALGGVTSGIGFGLVIAAATVDLFGPVRRRMATMA